MAKKSNPKPPPVEVVIPQQNNSGTLVNLPEGDNNKYNLFVLDMMQLPRIDVNDPAQVQARTMEYFKLCADHDMKPGVAAYGFAIGIDRRRLWEIKTGQERQLNIPKASKDYIIQTYNALEVLWEMYNQNGKINPVTGIFLGKNNFGYADKQEYIVTPKTMDDSVDVEAIEAKYAELPED